MNRNNNILSVERLSKHFGGLHALENLDIIIKKGQIHGIIGPNGAGKTTLFNVITGQLEATSGKIYFDSTDITNYKPFNIANIGIIKTFQAGTLAPNMTVLENVMSGAYTWSKRDITGTFFHLPFISSAQEKKIKREALELLGSIGLVDSANRWSKDLVWVERQLVQIARALAAKPKLLLLDEPTAGMGAEESKVVEGTINKIRKNLGITVVVVSHDVRLVVKVSDWVTCINFGGKISEGIPNKIVNDPKVLEAYLGEE